MCHKNTISNLIPTRPLVWAIVRSLCDIALQFNETSGAHIHICSDDSNMTSVGVCRSLYVHTGRVGGCCCAVESEQNCPIIIIQRAQPPVRAPTQGTIHSEHFPLRPWCTNLFSHSVPWKRVVVPILAPVHQRYILCVRELTEGQPKEGKDQLCESTHTLYV